MIWKYVGFIGENGSGAAGPTSAVGSRTATRASGVEITTSTTATSDGGATFGFAPAPTYLSFVGLHAAGEDAAYC